MVSFTSIDLVDTITTRRVLQRWVIERSRLERKYRRHPTPTTKSLWRSQFSQQRAMYQLKFTRYWSRKITNSAGNSRQLWSHLRRLLSEPQHTASIHCPQHLTLSTITCSSESFNTGFPSIIQHSRGLTRISQTEPKQSMSTIPSQRSSTSAAACHRGRPWVQKHSSHTLKMLTVFSQHSN